MPNTYTQISIHAVFAVARRESVIEKSWRDRLHEYISGILRSETRFPLAVGGWMDHVHIFFELDPNQKVADVLRVVKSKSSGWINDQGILPLKFHWQEGYGAFSHSRSQQDTVIRYIMNQEAHHRSVSFKEEYRLMLEQNQVDFQEQYLFQFFE